MNKTKITKELIENLVKKGATYTPPKENSLGIVESFLDLTTIKKLQPNQTTNQPTLPSSMFLTTAAPISNNL